MNHFKIFQPSEMKLKQITQYIKIHLYPPNRPLQYDSWDASPDTPIIFQVGRCIFCGGQVEYAIYSGLDVQRCTDLRCGFHTQRKTENILGQNDHFEFREYLTKIDCSKDLFTMLGCAPTLDISSELKKMRHRIEHESQNRTNRRCLHSCFVCAELNQYGERQQDFNRNCTTCLIWSPMGRRRCRCR